jgi:hypothetical protein
MTETITAREIIGFRDKNVIRTGIHNESVEKLVQYRDARVHKFADAIEDPNESVAAILNRFQIRVKAEIVTSDSDDVFREAIDVIEFDGEPLAIAFVESFQGDGYNFAVLDMPKLDYIVSELIKAIPRRGWDGNCSAIGLDSDLFGTGHCEGWNFRHHERTEPPSP